MARSCSVCSHPARAEIEAALARGLSVRAVAGRFGVSRSSLDRHVNNGHAPAARDLQALSGEVENVRDIATHADPFEQLKALREASLDALNASRRRGDDALSIAWTKEARALIQAEIDAQSARVAFENSREGARAALDVETARRRKMLELAEILHGKISARINAARAIQADAPTIDGEAVPVPTADLPEASPEAQPVRRRSRAGSSI